MINADIKSSNHNDYTIDEDIINLIYDFAYSISIHHVICSRCKDSYNPNNVQELFWHTISANCLQQGVSDWCKVFGAARERTNYTRIHALFVNDFERAIEGENINYLEYSKAMRNFRDKFIAHRDSFEKREKIPYLDQALKICDLFEKMVISEKYGIPPYGRLLDYYEKSKLRIEEYLDAIGLHEI